MDATPDLRGGGENVSWSRAQPGKPGRRPRRGEANGERLRKTKGVSEIGRERERERGKVAEGCGDEEMEGRPIRGREDLSADDGCARMARGGGGIGRSPLCLACIIP